MRSGTRPVHGGRAGPRRLRKARFVRPFGGGTLFPAPPLIFSAAQADRAVQVRDAALTQLPPALSLGLQAVSKSPARQ